MKAQTNNDGTKAKPINPYTLEVPTYDKHGNIDGGYIDDDYIKFEEQYPERFLTIPQQANSVIEIEPETVWQKSQKYTNKWQDAELSEYNNYKTFSNFTGWVDERGYITREAYKPAEQSKELYKVGDMVKIEKAEWRQTENGFAKCDTVGEIISIKDEHSHPNVHDYLVRCKQGDHYINHGDKRLSLAITPELKEAAEKQPFEHYPELADKLLHAASFWKTDDTWSATLNEINKVCAALIQSTQDNKRIVEVLNNMECPAGCNPAQFAIIIHKAIKLISQ